MEKTEKVMEKVMENHGIFCDLKSTNPDLYVASSLGRLSFPPARISFEREFVTLVK